MNTSKWLILSIAALFLISGAVGGISFGRSIGSITGLGGPGSESDLGGGTSWAEKPVWHTERITVELPAYIKASTFGGSITVNAHERNEIEIRIHIRKDGSYLYEGEQAPVEITVTETPNGVEIGAEPEKEGWFRSGTSLSVSYDILVPELTEVRASTSGGSVSAFDIAHNVSLITSGGAVTAERITGEVLARTSGGPVNARDITGDLTARTSGGGIRITNASGKLSVHTSGGPIRLDGVSGAVEARTSGGPIDARILLLEDHLTLRTSGGSIKAILPRGQGMDIRASGTNVWNRLEDLTGDISSRNIQGSVRGGGIPVELKTSGGSVEIEYGD
ncbi:MAG: DUF4097 family beta strand repeat-containing protein [Cyclonatronaceae bacterium]